MSNSGPYRGPLEQVDDCRWRIPRSYKPGMRVDGMIFASEALVDQIKGDQAPEQVANVACLPGIQQASLAMPDIHWGYGFCIGGVCATDPQEGGVISPGGVGYDINCGVRLVRTNLHYRDVKHRIQDLADVLFAQVPAGVGREGRYVFQGRKMDELLAQGTHFLSQQGLATDRDLSFTEATGRMTAARPEEVSHKARQRGAKQCGTLGSGNHFLEVQIVDAVFDDLAAQAMGLEKDLVCVMIHSGSRGLGYQVCDDALRSLRGVPERHGIQLPDRQLACAPIDSLEGQSYLGAMCAAANFAWCNRQLLMWQARECFEAVFGRNWEQLGMELVYDVAHNIAKLEEHEVAHGERRSLWVHRKGATRAFPAGHRELPEAYQTIGQPVLIPGDMGRASWVMAGQPGSMSQTFGSACHGAGRRMSRTAAVKAAQGRDIQKELLRSGVHARAKSWKGLAEEQPDAYKDVNQVIDVVHRANLASRVARMRPIAVVKG
ncbi:MAG: RtcB family protein [Planctomycetales bacterium]|nr:RtcB family protein [Planctomycetales bacterium]